MPDFFTGYCSDGSPSDDTTSAVRFGLCDDPPSVPPRRAYLDTANPARWIAKVDNSAGYIVTFKGVDACLIILRPDGTDEERCDGMLLYGNTVLFVELKERTSAGWLGKATGQLQLTVEAFRAAHGGLVGSQLKADVANSKRPLFQHGYQHSLNSFFRETNVVLRVEDT
ncbi:MAG: hypothetical protein EOO61_13225, partial [Hymenobacter sp.]